MTWIFFFCREGGMGSQKKLVSWRPEGEEEEKRVEKKNKRNFANPLVRVLRYLGGFSTWRGLPPPSWSRMKRVRKKKNTIR